MSKEKSVLFPAVPAVFCTLLWGTAFPGIKAGYELFSIDGQDSGSMVLFAGLRFFIAGFIVLLIGGFKEKKLQKLIPHKNDLLPISVLAFFQTLL